MSFIEVKSFAKINLALNVTGKLKLLHKIESIVSFISLSDLIFIKKIKGPDHRISFYGNFSKNIDSDNTVVKLFKILDKKKLLIPKIWKSFLPFRLSSEPWQTPILKINDKQINGEIVK